MLFVFIFANEMCCYVAMVTGEKCMESEVVVRVLDLMRTYVIVCKTPDQQVLQRYASNTIIIVICGNYNHC